MKDGGTRAGLDCTRMLDAQAMYGPHGRDSWSDGVVQLGRALYRLLPEDRFDRQPLIGADGTSALVADLRLDNRDELVALLGIEPAAESRSCDAQILLLAVERWDEGALDRIVGDYAFAWWRPEQGRLLLARDPIGQRPLHFHQSQGFFAFATMPKGLHALPDVPYAPDETRVAELLALIPETGSRSFFEEISRVEPGHIVTVTRDGVSTRRYWNPRPVVRRQVSAEAAAEGLRAQLDQAVAARLRGGEGRVGAHLSAGIDSGAVATTAARLLANGGGEVVAFTAVPRRGYDGPNPDRRFGDEGPLAAETAALHPNMEHVLVPTPPGTPLDGVDRDFLLFDRPTLNPCNMPWIAAINAEAKRRRLTVLLNGQMGNMTISYGGLEQLPELAARGRFITLFRLMRALVRQRHMRWRGALIASFGRWLPTPLWRAIYRIKGETHLTLDAYSAIDSEHYRALGLARVASERGLDPDYRPRRDPVGARLWALGRTDPGLFNKGQLAGWGVDLRDPTADRRLIEYCLSLPHTVWMEGGQPRALARRALADRLPGSVLHDRRKGLQGIDWHEGATAGREALRVEIERLGAVPAAARALDLAKLQGLVDDWPTDGWHRADVVAQYRLSLLRGVTTGQFVRKASRTNA